MAEPVEHGLRLPVGRETNDLLLVAVHEDAVLRVQRQPLVNSRVVLYIPDKLPHYPLIGRADVPSGPAA